VPNWLERRREKQRLKRERTGEHIAAQQRFVEAAREEVTAGE
jgi:hypothetical protein